MRKVFNPPSTPFVPLVEHLKGVPYFLKTLEIDRSRQMLCYLRSGTYYSFMSSGCTISCIFLDASRRDEANAMILVTIQLGVGELYLVEMKKNNTKVHSK